MSLTQAVANLVCELGEVSGDALLPYLPEYSREQVFQALQNARYSKKIRIVRRGKPIGRGSRPGVYAPPDGGTSQPPPKEPMVRRPMPVNSIFQLGDRAGAQACG